MSLPGRVVRVFIPYISSDGPDGPIGILSAHLSDPHENVATYPYYPLVNVHKKLLKPWPSRNSGFTHESPLIAYGDFP